MKNTKKYFSVLKGVKLPWVLIIGCLAFSIIMMRAELQVATMTSGIIDSSQYAINGKELISYVVMVVVSAVCTVLSTYFTRKMEEVISLRVRVKLWDKIMRLPIKYYDEDNGNELVTRITSDATSPSSLFTIIVSFVVCVVTTVQAFIQLFDYHKTLATYALVIIPLTLIFCVLYAILQFKLGVYSTATMAGSLGYIAERVRNFRLIKSAATQQLEVQKGSATFKNMYKADFLNWLLVAGYQISSGIFSIMFIVIAFVLGGQLVQKGEVTIGDLTGFYMVTGVVSMQLMQFFMNAGSIAGIFGTMKKISQIMDCETEDDTGENAPQDCEDIIFENVSFSYNEDAKILKDISFIIPKGSVTAIIGGNGAGKSTVFKLITRLYEPDEGKILFGTEDIKKYSLTSWRDKFSYVLQNIPLMDGSVRENITYGLDRTVTDEELTEAAKKAHCYECIMEKPAGFDEDTGLDGGDFSGGQAQCISIARAILKNSEYLLLDEATSNLDVVSEACVTEAMGELMKNKTTVIIAHSYPATKNANYIIVMKDGMVDASGTPEELMKTNEYYKSFVHSAE